MSSLKTAAVACLLLAAAACGRSGPPALDVPVPGGDDDDDVATTSTPVPTPRPAIPGDLVINEVYFNLAVCTTDACDANRSGSIDAADDEFVELVSIATVPVILDGVEIWESDQALPRFEFGAGTILDPLSAVVVFGSLEGTSSGAPAFGGSLVFETTAGLDLNNGGDTLTVKDGIRVFGSATWGGLELANFSWVLDPEITGGANYVTHPAHLDETGTTQRNASPGRRVDFTPF